jgi:D-alanyl-D-alanine carboxypeptidase
MIRKLAATSVILCFPAVWGGVPTPAVSSPAADLEGLLQSARSQPALVPVAMLRAVAPGLALAWDGVAGTAAARPRTLRIASNTKTYVAAATLRLMEEGRLDLDAPVSDRLLPESRRLLEDGGYDVRAMTTRMLLQHTSGLSDHASSAVFLERVATRPDHRWSRHEQIQIAMLGGGPCGAPGERFCYSDTGYLLLGEILETTTDLAMAEAVRSLLELERLGISCTWFETLEPEPPDAPARLTQWFDGVDVETIDASVDLFGGGGLLSTLPDMTRFYRSLLQGEVFRHDSTLAMMIEPSPQSIASGEGGYGMGLVRLMIDDQPCYGHGGFWGTEAWHCPGPDVTVAGAVSSTSGWEVLRKMTRSALALLVGADVENSPYSDELHGGAARTPAVRQQQVND